MRRRISSWALAAAACGALLLGGCATPETRISENPGIFQGLSPSDRALVQRGEIRPGLSQGGVYLAWGAPEQKTVANVKGRPAETWVYGHYQQLVDLLKVGENMFDRGRRVDREPDLLAQ